MAFSNIVKTPTVLEQLLEEINFQRTKEMRQLMKDGEWNARRVGEVARRFGVCCAARDDLLDGSVREALPVPKRVVD